MKALSNICKVLTAVSAAATSLFFFFDFFVIKGFYSLTGINMIVNTTKTVASTNQVVTTYKSSWYIVAFILAIVTAVFAVLGIIKSKQGGLRFKGMKYATAGAGALLAINMLVIFCSSYTSYLDVRTSPATDITLSMVTRQPAAVFAVVAAMLLYLCLLPITQRFWNLTAQSFRSAHALKTFSRITKAKSKKSFGRQEATLSRTLSSFLSCAL